MPNTFSNVKTVGSIIAKRAAALLSDRVQFCKSIGKEEEATFGSTKGFKNGDTANISKPARFIPTTTADITSDIQNVTEETTPIVLNERHIIGLTGSSLEFATVMELKQWDARVLEPAMDSLAQTIDARFLTLAKNNTFNSVGTPGSTVYDTDTMLSAGERLSKCLAPQDEKLFALLEATAMRSAVNARKGLFQSSSAIAEQYKMGYIGQADGFTYLRSNLMPSHTNGADVAVGVEATVVTIANGMSTLGVDGVTSSATIKAGSVFTIASCYAVHPITKATLPYLQQFVVTADVTEASGNSVTMSISPAIYYTAGDPRRNVSTAPVDEDAVTFLGSASTTYQNNLVYHKDAYRMVSVPLITPKGMDVVGQETVDGFTVRVLRGFDIKTDQLITRLDFLGAFAAVRPEWACRIWS